jgi:hypothetical protein
MLVDPYKLGKSDGRSLGRRDGIRAAITWLLKRAREMNDPQAKAILNSAAFSLGQDQKYRESELAELATLTEH